ncbi:hypothetical protein BegalDRAFT_0013 [Beggiatoa alba B18LD]|uniref:Sugar kinase n=1 Tax=Beggiatoa alba B18LD TaxID=395493 RepID=I3CBE7_9GAMM|nr:hypothetical protein [Beggiatoa alba]EIJ40940.1 hypothetical protein BegalDRAFT_0013 [Beggiatoa alba B18LD]
MFRTTENKIILVTRHTRLDELKARFNTRAQAKFYVEQLGADFSDYVTEHETYQQAIEQTLLYLNQLGRVHLLDRRYLPNFIFAETDTIVVLGQDGLVANTLKYLNGQSVIGVNPDPRRYDGVLLPFTVQDLKNVVTEVFARRRSYKTVTMAQAILNNGLKLYAVNDLFIGTRSHGSARYQIQSDIFNENQSSSGVIVSTGLGSTGWFKSLLVGANAIMQAWQPEDKKASVKKTAVTELLPAINSQFAWDSDYLCFTVREPFISTTSTAHCVFGKITPTSPLIIVSQMAENGVVFSDGIESDFLEFNAGTQATISIADKQGILVI